MSINRKGDIPSRRLDDTIELLRVDKHFDGYVDKPQATSLGEFPADIEQMKGGRFAYYQSLGYNHPMIIRMRDPEIEFQAARFGGHDIIVKNRITDPENSNYIILTADYTDETV